MLPNAKKLAEFEDISRFHGVKPCVSVFGHVSECHDVMSAFAYTLSLVVS